MSTFCEENKSNTNDHEHKVYDCVIVGGGVSGLSASRQLIHEHGYNPENVLVVDALEHLGGRILQTTEFVKGKWSSTCVDCEPCLTFHDALGVKVELGAEILHGSDTSLTKFAKEYNQPLQEIYCWAHGDGGPGKVPINGHYGLYYVGSNGNNKLYRFDEESDPEFTKTNDLIWEFGNLDESKIDDSVSLTHYMHDQGVKSEAMLRMVAAGFSNTLCTNTDELSMVQCVKWCRAWDEESPEDEDFKFPDWSYSNWWCFRWYW